jgi:uncharacterized Zn-binding protein involved in type VI secretion
MPGVQREGDFNMFGGIILDGEGSVRVNGRSIAVVQSVVSPHPPCPVKKKHCVAFTKGGSKKVRANGKSIILTGNKDTCGDSRVGGSGDVKAV